MIMAKAKQKGRMKRPAKMEKVLELVQQCIKEGRWYDTRHATDRQSERSISRLEIKQALNRGRHVPSRDRYDAMGWSYAIEGKTVDNRFLRIIVAFDEETQTLIVTAIDLDANT